MHTGLIFEWQIISPKQKLLSKSNLLKEIVQFRTKVYLKTTKSKEFELDTDEILDKNSYHIIAFVNGEIVGYIRITPLDIDIDCIFLRAFGKERFQTVYRQLTTENQLAEVSRWCTDSRFSPHFLGIKIFSGFWALIIKLQHNVISINGKTTNFCTQQGGAKLIENNPIYSAYYNDVIVPLYYQYNDPPADLLSLIQQMNMELNIDNLKLQSDIPKANENQLIQEY